jgi:hypothetical protein
MTVNQLYRELQKLKLDLCGDYEVMITDFTDEPPVPQQLKDVKVLKSLKKVFLQSVSLEDIVANVNKEKQK